MSKLNISEEILSEVSLKYPELTNLILNSTTLGYDDHSELQLQKSYWLTQLPILTDYQKQQLFDFLEKERKENLKNLNTQFQNKIYSTGSIK